MMRAQPPRPIGQMARRNPPGMLSPRTATRLVSTCGRSNSAPIGRPGPQKWLIGALRRAKATTSACSTEARKDDFDMAFVKLDTGILDSSLWVHRDPRDVFVT